MALYEDVNRQLAEDIAQFYDDPLGHVLYSYPWGEGALRGRTGPQKWQRDYLIEVGNEVRERGFDGIHAVEPQQHSTASGHGIGKFFPIAMPFTWHRDVHTSSSQTQESKMILHDGLWGDIKVGDCVFGADGALTRVTAIPFRGTRPSYRVTFDDGSSTVVGAEHEWNVRGRQERRKKLDTWRTLETQEILALGVKRANGSAMARQWEIPIQGAAQFATSANLPLDPYIMGLWISDGNGSSITKASLEVRARIASLHPAGVSDRGKRLGILGVDWKSDRVFKLRSWGKYIPDTYKYADVEQRQALFEGFMDGDGETHKSGSCGYSTSSEKLADDIIWLARSLGYKATLHPKVKIPTYTLHGEKRTGRPSYRVTINTPTNPFTHEERRKVWKASEARYLSRWIESIEPVGDVEGMCITVEAEDHLYLTNDFIVTHNSALVAWLIRWIMDTRPMAKGIVTANTGEQLRTKTWAELAKWHGLGITNHWWTLNSSQGAMNYYHKDYREQWRCDAQTCREENSEAFAGLHAANSTPFYIFDEASGIPDKIFEVREGGLTDGEPMTFDFGNPTRNVGRFHQNMQGKFRHRYERLFIDSRDVEQTNKELFKRWIDDYGIDSDFVKVRVRGIFPDAGSLQLIPTSLYENNVHLDVVVGPQDPLVMGVDVARFGEDESVIWMRQGRDAESQGHWRYRGMDTMTLASRIVELANKQRPDAVLIDGGGVGGGVIDRCRQLGLDVIEINFGSSATQNGMFNMRAQMWSNMKDALHEGVRLPDDEDLRVDLTSLEYGYTLTNMLKLESKDDAKKRGLHSPDLADALALTYALPIVPNRAGYAGTQYQTAQNEYDPF